ncbi:alpha-ketoglutarate-dependent taurine dioxygenase [Sclerotinia borealis F-4128]|uniref:Alpha-ketoglutarate-dependent taurine dioxygenase n=1 Tax=Sclerotinia borealis (strain F-4128) TaxID=1432307 RepID=W9C9T1_SCLBF|nr:alpha-ketoglutarate-dependent taurine dioxygenase [Sclerotinia borealis F-4128]
MAPSLEVGLEQSPTQVGLPASLPTKVSSATPKSTLSYTPGRTIVEKHETYEHEDLRPSFPDKKWPALKELPYSDKGLLGSDTFKDLLATATDVFDYVPKIGTEVHGVDLANLTDGAKNDLARFISIRGVVFFRNQKNFDIEAQRKLGSYFGTLHKHATTSVPKRGDVDDVHVVYTDEKSKDQRALFTPSFLWHSDVTYEIQPPSYTSLKVLSGPPRGGGGDTLWSSQYAAYDALSAPMQKYLESLTALHTSHLQAEGSRALGRPVRRDPITTEHPLIRSHPVTGWKSLFFNPGFVTKIVGIPKVESEVILAYLNEVVATTQELHVRFQWGKDDVAFWDNRISNHTASYGFAPHRRHAVRVCCHGEKPVLEESARSQEEELGEMFGLPVVNKDGSGQSNYND